MARLLKNKIVVCIIAVIIGSFAILGGTQFYKNILFPAKQSDIRNNYTVEIIGTEIAPRSAPPGYFYIIYAYDIDECIFRTFMLDDWAGRQNTSDWYGAITVGETYDIETMGERKPDLSAYPNIIAIEGLYTRADGRLTDLNWGL